MSEESIRQHLRAALDAIVSRETARLRDPVAGSDARIAGRARAMRPLIEAFKSVADETGDVGGLTIQPGADGEQAWIEMVNAANCCHSLKISTDSHNCRFEIEERQYFPLSGDRVSYLHCFDTTEEVLRFALQLIGNHIASRRTPVQRAA